MKKHNYELSEEGTCECPNCGGKAAHIITRVTGYFGVTSKWNKGKIGEWRQRNKEVNKQYFENKGNFTKHSTYRKTDK